MESSKHHPTHLNLKLNAPQKKGGILVGTGILLLVLGIILLRTMRADSNSYNILTVSIRPLTAVAGLILIGEGILLWKLKGQRLTAWGMVVPGVILILLVIVFPMLYAFGISFFQWDLTIPTRKFLFLGNYTRVLTSPRFWRALLNSVYIAGTAVVLELILGVSLSLLLVSSFPGRSTVVSIVIMPLMIAPIVVGETWRMLWDTRFGAVNHLFTLLTGTTVQLPWLSNPQLALPAIIITEVWQWTPFVALIAMAGLLAVDLELYEAAAIDGATSWKMFWEISVPIVRPVLLVAFLFRLVDGLKVFDKIYALTYGGPGYSTENIPFYLYQQGFTFGRFGLTAATSFIFLFIILMIVIQLVQRIGEM